MVVYPEPETSSLIEHHTTYFSVRRGVFWYRLAHQLTDCLCCKHPSNQRYTLFSPSHQRKQRNWGSTLCLWQQIFNYGHTHQVSDHQIILWREEIAPGHQGGKAVTHVTWGFFPGFWGHREAWLTFTSYDKSQPTSIHGWLRAPPGVPHFHCEWKGLQSGGFSGKSTENYLHVSCLPSRGLCEANATRTDSNVWEEITVITDICLCIQRCTIQATFQDCSGFHKA